MQTDEDALRHAGVINDDELIELCQRDNLQGQGPRSSSQQSLADSRKVLAEVTQLIGGQGSQGQGQSPVTNGADYYADYQRSPRETPRAENLEVTGVQLTSRSPTEVKGQHPAQNQIVPKPSSAVAKQPLSQSEHFSTAVLPVLSNTPIDLDVDQYIKEREKNTTPLPNQSAKLTLSYNRRIFQRTFPKQEDPDPNSEEVHTLSIEGKSNKDKEKVRCYR